MMVDGKMMVDGECLMVDGKCLMDDGKDYDFIN